MILANRRWEARCVLPKSDVRLAHGLHTPFPAFEWLLCGHDTGRSIKPCWPGGYPSAPPFRYVSGILGAPSFTGNILLRSTKFSRIADTNPFRPYPKRQRPNSKSCVIYQLSPRRISLPPSLRCIATRTAIGGLVDNGKIGGRL